MPTLDDQTGALEELRDTAIKLGNSCDFRLDTHSDRFTSLLEQRPLDRLHIVHALRAFRKELASFGTLAPGSDGKRLSMTHWDSLRELQTMCNKTLTLWDYEVDTKHAIATISERLKVLRVAVSAEEKSFELEQSVSVLQLYARVLINEDHPPTHNILQFLDECKSAMAILTASAPTGYEKLRNQLEDMDDLMNTLEVDAILKADIGEQFQPALY